MELKIAGQVRGVRFLAGDTAKLRREILNGLQRLALNASFEEVYLPSLELASMYADKAGEEVLTQMYVFPDRKDRPLCLRPEGTATLQVLADTVWKQRHDVPVWYETTCWRYERPQAGRYREFTQFGVEVLNPTKPAQERLLHLAELMVSTYAKEYRVEPRVKRGLAYYVEDGFEIICPELGAQQQVCGGGSYKQGCGFAIGVDRLMLAVR